MHRPGQLFGEEGVDAPLARDAAFAGEGRGDDLDVKVAFSLGTGAGMAGMAVRLVADIEPERLQSRGELVTDALGDAHEKSVGGGARPVKAAVQGSAAAVLRRCR